MYSHLINDLIRVFNENSFLSIIIDNRFKESNFDEHDKKLYTKIIYGVVEKRYLLDYFLKPFLTGLRVKPFIKNALRVGAYSITFLNVKNHFIVNKVVEVVKENDYKASKFVNAILRKYINTPLNDLNALPYFERLSTELSLDINVVKYLYKQYESDIINFYKEDSFNNTYRINLLKTTKEYIYYYLDDNNIKYNNIFDNDLVFDDIFYTNCSLINTKLFSNGLIIAQDFSSYMVAKTLNPTANSKILDVCSSPGSKSLHASGIMNNTGSIYSCDIYEAKLNKIISNTNKLSITNIKTYLLDASTTNYYYEFNTYFDYVICDVPCSGFGVLNHKPDLKYRINLDEVKDIILLQKKILLNSSKALKVGGLMVYSTCTINKHENEKQVKDFLLNNDSFTLIKEKTYFPTSTQDGFYIALLRKDK